MAKPICKAESRWSYWRIEGSMLRRGDKADKFVKWAKKQMSRAKRRFLKSNIDNE